VIRNIFHRCILLPALLAGLLALGCEVGPNYHKPNTALSPSFSEAATRPATQPANPRLAAIPTPQQLQRWWETFDDPELNHLVERSLNQNLDLQAAVQRIRQARAQLGIAGAILYPTVNSFGNYSHSRRSEHLGSSGGGGGSSSSGSGTTGTTGSGSSGGFGGGGAGLESDFYQVGFDSSWEIDVFGGERRGVEAAQANFDASIEARHTVLITLLGDVAADYIQLRGLQRQVAITQENITLQQQSLDLIQTKNRAGLAAELDVTRQQAQVLTTEAGLPELEAQIHQTIHKLSVLLALEPSALQDELEKVAPIPLGPVHVPPGLPSELLRRRPDIRQAERLLAASSANIGVATADLFPKFSITGALGLESSQFHQLFNEHSKYFSIAPGVSWTIFDANHINDNIEVQNALERQAYYAYQTAVLTGFQEVEDSLIAYAKEQDRREALEAAVRADQRSVEMTQDLYRNGLDTFLDVLTAQNSLLAGEQELTLSQQQVSADLVALYKALGGGWEVTPH